MERRGIRLTTIAGIQILLDPSVAIIFLLILVQLGLGTLPAWHPSWGVALTWSVAGATAVAFFASIVLHELSHALVGRMFGMRIRRVTLFLFGGAADLEEQPPSPGAEFWMAIAGPVTSLLIGVLCLTGVAVFAGPEFEGASLDVMDRLGPMLTILAWAGPINILLGLFNLTPGFPLDGGRVLRAAVWKATGDLDRATQVAATAGRVFAGLLIVGGLAMVLGISLPVFGRGVLGGVWLMLIGWFLWRAAAGSYQQVLADAALEGVQVRDVMVSAAPVDADITLAEFTREYVMKEGTAFEVVEGESTLLGVATIDDVRKVARERWGSTSVREIMTPSNELMRVAPNSPVSDVLRKMMRAGVGRVPVVSAGSLLGVVRRSDVLRWIHMQMPLPSREHARRGSAHG